MKKITQKMLDRLDEAGVEVSSIRDNYSGRFMYGRTTKALVVDDYHTAVEVLKRMGRRNVSVDNMGLSYVIY